MLRQQLFTTYSQKNKDNTEFNQYQQLNNELVSQFFCQLTQFSEFKPNQLNVQDIGDGNLNNVFRIITPKYNIILKQSLPYLKCVGKEHPLSNKRMYFEIAYHQEASKIINTFLPKLFYSDDETMMLMCMQDLHKQEVMREGLIKQIKYPHFMHHISTHLANIHFKTSRYYLNETEHGQLKLKFGGNELCDLTRDFIFIFPFINHQSNYLHNNFDRFDDCFREKAMQLLRVFLLQQEALIHGDLHTGSIMLNYDSTFIIDHEFAFMGPPAFDLGLLLANLLISLIYHNVKQNNVSYKQWLSNTIEKMLVLYSNKFIALYTQYNDINIDEITQHIENIIQQAYGFAGLEIGRRVCGIAGVKEIRGLANKEEREQAEQLGLQMSHYLVKNHEKISSPEFLLCHINNTILNFINEKISTDSLSLIPIRKNY